MPPIAAAVLCTFFISYVLWTDHKRCPQFSGALWIPQIWMLLTASRPISMWLGLSTPVDVAEVYIEGSPLDRTVYMLLIGAGIVVLTRRRLDWNKLHRQNWWIWLYFLFGAVSILWSDFPLVSLKRLIKSSGNIVMALVVLSESRPYEAAAMVLRRLGVILLPISVLFIKYYPALGRTYHRWTYEPMFTGAATHKNSLGQLCLITGIYFCWVLIMRKNNGAESGKKQGIFLNLAFVAMIVWLLRLANSATSLACLVLCAGIFLVSRTPFFFRKPSRIIAFGLAAVFLIALLQVTLDIDNSITGMLGRDPSLTNRVYVWNVLLFLSGNPVWGVGFESYWLGDRLEVLLQGYGHINQAHNGYLEIYLNLGTIGVLLILASMIPGLVRILGFLKVDYHDAMLRFSFAVIVILYNWTEATFYGNSNMWVIFLMGIIAMPGKIREGKTAFAQPPFGDKQRTMVNGPRRPRPAVSRF